MPAAPIDPTHAADLADLLWDLRGWIDAEEEQLEPLLTKHGYDLIGLRVSLDLFAALLTTSDDGEPPL